jgi:hypothetical protein
MIQAGSRVNSAINTSITSEWEMESALGRVVQQLRMCTALSLPTGVSGGTSFSLTTQPDASNGNLSYVVSYAVVTAVDGTKQLQESDPRFGTSTLINDVRSFDVRLKSASAPTVVVISITVGGTPPVTRTLRVTPRNL